MVYDIILILKMQSNLCQNYFHFQGITKHKYVNKVIAPLFTKYSLLQQMIRDYY